MNFDLEKDEHADISVEMKTQFRQSGKKLPCCGAAFATRPKRRAAHIASPTNTHSNVGGNTLLRPICSERLLQLLGRLLDCPINDFLLLLSLQV